MKSNLHKVLIGLSLLLFSFNMNSQQLAFPGAEGFGKYAVGGRNGTVYRVTNLNDSGAGSFRDAVSQPNRIVVFDVGGVIKINSRIVIKNNIYIAGQTAPGEGITIYGNGISLSGANNVIVRHLRVRMGAIGSSGQDAFSMANGKNMIFDHVSIAWGRDETLSVTSECENVTIQNSIISQGLLPHSAGSLIEPAGGVTIYRTLYMHSDTRNPKFKLTHQFVNNIVYNWKSAAYIMGGNSSSRSYANAVGNYFITGPAGSTNAFSGGNDRYSIYAEDNWVDKNRNGILDGNEIPQSEYGGGPTFVNTPYNYPVLPTISAQLLFEDMVNSVGASLPYRDNLDWMLIDDLKSLGTKGKIIGNENELLIGAPDTWDFWKGTSRIDSDDDGIPDEWEIANGLNPNDASDAMKIRDGYANIEHYINSITADNSQKFLKAPTHLQATKTTQNEVALEWLDYTDFEDGYIIEQKINDEFVEIARVDKDVNSFFVENLEPETNYSFRVKGYNSETETAYTNELTVKTRPIPVNALNPETFVPDLVWSAGNSGNWNLTDESWDKGKFESNKTVLFNEPSGGVVVSITEDVEQGNLVIKGDANYNFSGNSIAGSGSFNKTGNGTVLLGTNNKYIGSTVIWGGVIKIGKLANGGQPSSIGASENYDFNWVWNGGKIEYTGSTVTTNRNVALESSTEFSVNSSSATVTIDGVIAGEGDFIKSGAGKFYSTFGKHTYTGNTIVKEGVYELRGNYAEVGLKGKLILDGGTFRTVGGADGKDGIFSFPIEVVGEKKSYLEPTRNSQIKSKVSGSGDLQLNVSFVREFYTGNWDEYYGNLTVNGTTNDTEFMLSTSIPNSHIHLTNTMLKAGKNASPIVLGALSGDANSSLVCSHVKTAGGSATYKIGSMNVDTEFKGVVSSGVTHTSRKGRSNIVKEGDGYLRFTNTNKYLGTTTIYEGMLIVNGKHITDKDYDSNGNYSTVIPGAYTINNGGVLAGKGTITTSKVTVKKDGAVSPGDFDISNFTLDAPVVFDKGSSLIIEVNRVKNSNDRIIVKSSLTFNGSLNMILDDGEYKNGDVLTIFNATSYSGTLEKIVPETPANGLEWDTSELFTKGRLKIVESATGISNVKNSNIKIYNETDGIRVVGLEKYSSIILYNLLGNIVFSEKINYSEKVINEHKGVYFLRIDDEVFKVIVK